MYTLPHIVGERNQRPLEIQGSVALVGNSDALAGKGLGEKIDQYDHVFRFNLADLAPQYQSDCGQKVDYCLFSLNISTHKYPHSKAEHARFVSLCKKAKIICYPKNTRHVRKYNSKPLIMSMSMERLNQVFLSATVPQVIKFTARNHPRNGIKLLACIIEAGIKPDLFGFDIEDRGNNAHYFDDEKQLELPQGGHMPSREYRLLKELQANTLIQLI